MEKKHPTPRFDKEKLMTVNCLTRLIERKLARLVAVGDVDSSSIRPLPMSPSFASETGLELSSPHIECLELAMLNLRDTAICSALRPHRS